MSEDQQQRDERMWMQGQRSALLGVVRDSLATLGVLGHEDFTAEKLMLERAAVIDILRRLCDEFGDNQWNESDHLGDVIDKHLARYLYEDFVPEELDDEDPGDGELPSQYDLGAHDDAHPFGDGDELHEEPVEHDRIEDDEEPSGGDYGEVVDLWGDVGIGPIHEIDQLDQIFENEDENEEGDSDE